MPEPPRNLTITSCAEKVDTTVMLTWTISAGTNSSDEVEEFVLEQSLNGEKFEAVSIIYTINN